MSKANIPQKSPYVMDMEPGKYAWCSCGNSNNQPFCDGSHRETGFTPLVVELAEAKKVAWCGCKQSGSKPYCDGAHNKLS